MAQISRRSRTRFARKYLMVALEYPVERAEMQRETMELVLGEVPTLSAFRATYICNTHPGMASQNISMDFVNTVRQRC